MVVVVVVVVRALLRLDHHGQASLKPRSALTDGSEALFCAALLDSGG